MNKNIFFVIQNLFLILFSFLRERKETFIFLKKYIINYKFYLNLFDLKFYLNWKENFHGKKFIFFKKRRIFLLEKRQKKIFAFKKIRNSYLIAQKILKLFSDLLKLSSHTNYSQIHTNKFEMRKLNDDYARLITRLIS